jgi:hypothetical protein
VVHWFFNLKIKIFTLEVEKGGYVMLLSTIGFKTVNCIKSWTFFKTVLFFRIFTTMNFSLNCSLTVLGRFHFQESSRAFVPDRSQPGRWDASRRKEPVITCKACQPPENTPGNSSFKSY